MSVTEAAKEAGLYRENLSDIERGKNRNPTTETLTKIAAALGVTLAELFLDEKGESVTLT